jgi:hypothetical protein
MLRTMRSRLSSKRLGLALAALAAAITLGVVLTVWPRHWRVTNQDGSLLCTISKGWSSREVAAACGAASKVGDQPEVLQSWRQSCSAPCELRGRNLVFYDCEKKVARVEALSADWQGCVFR